MEFKEFPTFFYLCRCVASCSVNFQYLVISQTPVYPCYIFKYIPRSIEYLTIIDKEYRDLTNAVINKVTNPFKIRGIKVFFLHVCMYIFLEALRSYIFCWTPCFIILESSAAINLGIFSKKFWGIFINFNLRVLI